MADNWIQKSIKKPGALRKQLKIKKGQKLTITKLEKAEKPLKKKVKQGKKLNKNELTKLRRINLAKTLIRMKK